jgi:hypothetical protein
MRGLQLEEGEERRAELHLVGGWEVELWREFRMRLERARSAVKLPPIPDEDPE